LILFGSTPQSLRTPLSASAWEVMLPLSDAAVFVNKARTVAALLAVAATACLFWFINRSRLGKALRAAADNPEAAMYMGIDVDRAHRIAFGIGTGVTAMAGGLVATYYPFQPYVGLEFVIIMYAGVVLGGMGNLWGVVAATALLTMLPELLRGFAEWRMILYSLLIIVTMILRSKGVSVKQWFVKARAAS